MRNITATIVADVKRFSHQINTDEVFDTHTGDFPTMKDRNAPQKPGGRLVVVDSLQIGDEPDYGGMLELFPRNYHEPYYSSYLKEDFRGIAAGCGLNAYSRRKRFRLQSDGFR